MDLLTKLKGLTYLGPLTLLASGAHALRRDAVEWLHRPRRAAIPAAAPGAVLDASPVESGLRLRLERAELEVVFLAPDLVRVTWTPGRLPIPYGLARTEWPPVPVLRQDEDRLRVLRTPELTVQIGDRGELRFLDARGRLLREDLPPVLDGAAWTHRARLRDDERVAGLGERTAPLDLRGGTYRLWNLEANGSYGPGQDPIYLCLPVCMGFHAEGSWLAFFENTHDGCMSLRDLAETRFVGGALRYYLVPGPPQRALERFTGLAGRAPLPPRWALGFHQSRWSYGSDAEVRELVDGFRARGLPLGAVHLDIHYMRGHRVFTVDEKRFPDLPKLAADLEREGVRLVAIVDPAVKSDPLWDVFRDGRAKDVFCKGPGGRPFLAPVWPGPAAFPDFTSPRVRDWWGSHYDRLLDAGFAGVWHDMNEPAAFAAWGEPTLPRPVRHDLEGRGGDHAEAHNVYALLETRAGFEALRRLRPERRPWLLTRSGWAGLQRYTWTWTGDSESNWWSVHQTVRMALSLGLCGVPYTGPDIGGFGGFPDAELFVRWFQLGALLPFFRVHAAWYTPRREPWSFGDEVLGIAAEFLRLRQRLMPYLETLAHETTETGHPWVRPVFWHDGYDPSLWTDDEYLLGDALLVAPVVAAGARSRTVVFPRGRWYSLWDDAVVDGPARVDVPAPFARLPVFVRAGTILPMEQNGALELHLYAPVGSMPGGRVYSDEGDGYGPHRVDRFALSRQGAALLVERTEEGAHPFPWKRVELRVHGARVRTMRVDGREVALTDDLGRFGQLELVLAD